MDNSSHWTEKYLNLPWRSGGRGPEAFDCYGLVVETYRERLGVELAPFPELDACNAAQIAHTVKDQLEEGIWTEIHEPLPLCVVGMSTSKFVRHVGIWIPEDKGLIFHAREKAHVSLERMAIIRSRGISQFTFYKHCSQ